ncbi:MAG: hypothetical protein EXS14_09150 [Planctomycetes bacterium]|nr:hypothetical protein [Planctomycetota bacterium]
MDSAQDHAARERAAEIRATDDRVWDMVGNLVHPAALYVLLQLLIIDRFSNVPPWSTSGPLSALAIGLYVGQFLGAWAVLCTTLLRDMGLRSCGGTLLLLGASATVVLQYLLPIPAEMPTWFALTLPSMQALLGGVVFLLTWLRWRREKKLWEQGSGANKAALLAPLVALFALPQQARADGADVSAASDDFFSWVIWIIVLVPALAVMLLALKKRKSTPQLPHVTDFTWVVEVTDSRLPVIVHAYHAWSIGDRVVESQVQRLDEALRGRARVLWLDLDKNPVTQGQFPTLEARSVAFFREGTLLWQSTGVQDYATMLAELERLKLLPLTAEYAQ